MNWTRARARSSMRMSRMSRLRRGRIARRPSATSDCIAGSTRGFARPLRPAPRAMPQRAGGIARRPENRRGGLRVAQDSFACRVVGRVAPYADLPSGDEHDGAGHGRIPRGRRGSKTARRAAAGGSTRPARFLRPCNAVRFGASSNASTSSNTSAPRRVTDEQLRRVDSAHVAWVTPSGSQTPTVQVELMSPTPMNIVGAPDDADVQHALTFLLENGQRFDPDVRLDSLDVLRRNAADPDVRRTLCAAARLTAIPACAEGARCAAGIRAGSRGPRRASRRARKRRRFRSARRSHPPSFYRAAIRRSAWSPAAHDPQTVAVLRDRQHNDPSSIVRQQSAAALRALGEQ